MLERDRVLLHRIDVRPALVGESALADEGHALIVGQVNQVVHVKRNFAQFLDAGGRHAALTHLQLQGRNHCAQVGVATTLTVTIDRALYLRGTGTHGLQRVGDANTRVIVGMNTHRHAD